MNIFQFVWGFFLTISILFFGTLFLRPETKTGTVVEFVAGEGDTIEISSVGPSDDTGLYDVSASGVGYFRITSGNDYVEGSYLTGNNFAGSGTLPGPTMSVVNGESHSYVISANATFSATHHQSIADMVTFIVLATLIGLLFFLLGYVFLDD